MNDKLRLHIEKLFENAPKTKQSVELKEEILQNTIDRYNDLISEGKTPVDAYNLSVAGIGDISHLIDSITAPIASSGYTRAEIEKNEKKRNILLTISVMLYIVSIVPVMFSDISENDFLAEILCPAFMFIIIAVATGLLIYRSGMKLKYHKTADTVVEEFKEWNRDTKERRSLLTAINSGTWIVTLAVYFVLSFLTGAWYITWLVIIIGRAITGIITAVYDLNK